MSFTITVTEKTAIDGESISSANAFTGSGRASVDETIALSQTDKLVAFSLDVSSVVAFYMVSDVACTVETNATDHAGGNIITLVAGIPYVWYTGKYDTFLLTSDVTKLYITTGGTAAHLQIDTVYDATT